MVAAGAYESVRCLLRRLSKLALLAMCLVAISAGCSVLPGPVLKLPSKIGVKSQEAELRAKVEADKFPTAKEAGL
jgi:hypothetical protein